MPENRPSGATSRATSAPALPRPPLHRDPAVWAAAPLIAVSSVYTAWEVLRLAVPRQAVAIGGASTLVGSFVVGSFAFHLQRGTVLRGVDRTMSWLVVSACFLYWFVALASPNGATAPGGGLVGTGLFVAALALVPLVVTGLLLLPRVKPARVDVALFQLDLVIVAFASAMLLWHFVLYPVGHSAGAGLLFMIAAAIRPSADLALVFLAIAVGRVPVPGIT